MPSTGCDAPTASCSVLPFCWHRVAFWGQGRGVVFVGGWDSGLEIPPIAAYDGSVGMTVRGSRRDSGGKVRGKVRHWGSKNTTREMTLSRPILELAAAGLCPVCHPERAERAEGSPCWNRCRLGGKGLALFSKSDTMTKESLNRAAGGRCIAAGRWYAEKPTTVRCPRGVQGPRPLVGKGFSKGETTIGFTL